MKLGQRLVGTVGAAVCLLLAAGCGDGGSGQTFVIRYDRPAAVEIPDNIKTIAVTEFAGKSDRDRRYGDIVSGKLESQLDSAGRQFGRYKLVDRKKLKEVMDERDLAIANSDQAVKAGKLASADAIIYGNISAVSRDEHLNREVIDPLSQSTKTQYYTKRFCQVVVSFSMVDVNTSKLLKSHTATREYDSEKSKKGGMSTFSKFTGIGGESAAASDEMLNSLVEECVKEFVGMISPTRVELDERLAKGKGPLVTSGNKLAVAGDAAGALDYYNQAVSQNHDDAGAMFNAGLMCESLGRFRDAEGFYARAFGLKSEDQYAKARARVRVDVSEAKAGRGSEKNEPEKTAEASGYKPKDKDKE